MNQASHARSRAGFTLIELLIVMAIIAVLAALLLAGISAVRWRGYDAKEVNDIKQLEIALNAFKADKKIYPPSRIVLYPKYDDYVQFPKYGKPSICGEIQLDADSLQAINRIWPNIGGGNLTDAFYNGINWARVDNPAPPGFPKYVILEADQCLVFFLGGLYSPDPTDATKYTCIGFSPAAKNPIMDVFDPNTKLALDRKRYFDFPAGRLDTTKSKNSANPGYLFPSFIDNYGQMPYVYFAPGLPGSSTPNAYNVLKHQVTFDGGATFVSPYYKTVTSFWNPTTFQIISAGRDGLFGNVGQWDNGTSATASTPAWKDNRTNFSSFVLAAQAQ